MPQCSLKPFPLEVVALGHLLLFAPISVMEMGAFSVFLATPRAPESLVEHVRDFIALVVQLFLHIHR